MFWKAIANLKKFTDLCCRFNIVLAVDKRVDEAPEHNANLGLLFALE